jgi:hypothetical protein
MKKKYETPKAEKMEFDYIESVVACCSRYPYCVHTGAIPNPTNPSINPTAQTGGGDGYNSNPNGQFYKCGNSSYYGAGWGQNC